MLTKTTTLLAKNSNGRLSYIFGRLILVHFFSFRTNFGQKFPTLRYNCYNAKTSFRSTDKKKNKKKKQRINTNPVKHLGISISLVII